MNIAIWLTLSRLLLLPLAIITLALHRANGGLISASFTLLAGLTDFGDGYLARKSGHVTPLGTNLDFFIDKVFIGGMLITLAWMRLISAWIPALVLARELAVSILRFRRFHWRTPSADVWGKTKTALSFTAIIWVALRQEISAGGVLVSLNAHLNISWILGLAPWILFAAVVLTVISGLNYLWNYTRRGSPA